MKTKHIPIVIFAFIGLYFIGIGVLDLSIREVSQLPWIEALVPSDNPANFDVALAILTRWIGMLLIVCGLAVLVITRALIKRGNEFQIFALGILSCGVLGAQCLTLITVGAPPQLYTLPIVLLVAVIVAIIMQLWQTNVDRSIK